MAPISLTERATVDSLEQVGQPSCRAYSQRGQICGEAPARIGQPHSLQLMTGSPNMPRTSVPQRRPPQGPVPTPVRLLTCSKVFAPARIALSTVPLRILLQMQAGLRFSITAWVLASCSDWSMASYLAFAVTSRSL